MPFEPSWGTRTPTIRMPHCGLSRSCGRNSTRSRRSRCAGPATPGSRGRSSRSPSGCPGRRFTRSTDEDEVSMSSSASTSSVGARPRFGRRAAASGPRASFRQLLPYLFEHRSVLALVLALSVLGAAASLAQPLLVAQVINRVEAGDPLGLLVWLLVLLVILSGLMSGYEHYLLQRTGEGVVLSSRKQLVARML